MQEAWDDTYVPITDVNNPEVRAFVTSLPAEEQATITAEDAVLRTNERLKRQHSLTIPITANLVALIFVSLADLTQDQRQVLTSLMAHRNRPLADYRMEELREVYLEVFCTTRTSVENPLLAPSGNAGRKSFLIIEEGYLDQHEGFWVEDDGAEGLLELDEDAFWVYDEDSAAWFQRRFQGRRMKRGQKGRRKGKGKGGKGRGGRRFFRRKKGRSNVAEEQQDAWQAWDWQDGGYDEDQWSWEPHSEESYAMKGKGKKGKKGKNKGKWSSKDGKGDGGKDHFANTASETPQPSSSTTHQTFFAMNADYDLLREFESKEDLHVPHDPCVQSFMSVPEDEFSYLTHALTPTSMVLDLGCTRAMTSKRAAQGLMEFCDAHPDCGLWYRLDQTTSQFTFANSESASCRQKIVVCMYDRDYAIQSTEFDIVEQGEVPILMSLPRMRNLRFHFDLHPDKAYLSSPVLGIKNMVLKVARSTHLILDLLDVCHHMWNVKFEQHKKVSFFTNGIHFEYGNIAKSEEALAVNDEWILDEEEMESELIRLHKRGRHETYLPTASPIPTSTSTPLVRRSTSSPTAGSLRRRTSGKPL